LKPSKKSDFALNGHDQVPDLERTNEALKRELRELKLKISEVSDSSEEKLTQQSMTIKGCTV